jgi:hypothetical protein
MINRRAFLRRAASAGLLLGPGLLASQAFAQPAASNKPREARADAGRGRQIMTVRGAIDADEMGMTLTHEHLLADFRPYEEKARNPRPYNPDEAVEVGLPHLKQL